MVSSPSINEPNMKLINLIVTLFAIAMIGVMLFFSAGTWRLPVVWLYLGIDVALALAATILLSADLMRERLRPGQGNLDDLVFILSCVLLLPAHWVLAGLDMGRYGWSAPFPKSLQVIGFAGFTASMAFIIWAMKVNPFLSSLIRIQKERGHYVISDGPYHFVRHPSYAGAIVYMLCSALALGSWPSMLPVLVWSALLVPRTLHEEDMLFKDLEGYREYAKQVRFRLFPGVW
jgi:protein-S-isoprenylcysteine O-methyltransferase Ste14